MRRWVIAAVTAVGLLAGGLVGCGIPDQTGVTTDGTGPARGVGSGSPPLEPPKRTDAENVEEFTRNFLMAAAGESSGAYERVTDYIAPTSRGILQQDAQGQDVAINIVRVTNIIATPNRDGTSSVQVSVQQVGVLTPDGAVERPKLSDTTYAIEVGKLAVDSVDNSLAAAGLYITSPPLVLLMSVEALDTYYDQRPIYFWSRDGHTLVPDLRHLPVAVPPARRATEVLQWLTRGPADWLKDSVDALPPGTALLGNVTQDGAQLSVPLSIELPTNQRERLARLGTQIAWSLPEVDAGRRIDIKVKGESRETFDAEVRRHAAPVYRIADGGPQRFCVYDGEVRALTNPDTPPAPVPLADGVNHDIVAATLSREERGPIFAALVVAAGGRQRLRAGSGADVLESLGSSRRTFGEMSRPVWLKSSAPTGPLGLVVADAQLYQFDRDAALVEVEAPGKVSAVAAAPDGRRIAFIAGGQLYVAALTIVDGSVLLAKPRPLRSSLRDLTAVEWSGESNIIVAGLLDRQVTLYEMTVDGTQETNRASERGTVKVIHLAAYPANPVHIAGGGRVMYEAANGVVWDSLTGRIDPGQVDGSPRGSAGPEPRIPTAPFFLY